MRDSAAQPLYQLIRRIRKPAALRHLMARCLRHIYTGDPFSKDVYRGKADQDGDGASGGEPLAPQMPTVLLSEVILKELELAGMRCVLYLPHVDTDKLDLILYFHGGGFVIGCSEDTDYTTRKLAFDNKVAVLSINYGLAPEVGFPAALDQCLSLFTIIKSRENFAGIKPEHIILAGDSAGGNLAAALALRLHGQGQPAHALILLAPWLDMRVENYESYNRLAPDGIVFDAPFMAFARASYAPFEAWDNCYASPINAKLEDLPPTLIVVGSADPLFDQSTRFVGRARAAMLSHIELVSYDDMPHCFYSFPGLFEQERDCYARIEQFLIKNSAPEESDV